MDSSIKYIVDKIEQIEVLGHKRFQIDVDVNPERITITLDEEIDPKVKLDIFYRKWNFKLFEVLKEIFDNGETSVWEPGSGNTTINFKNSICDQIEYTVYKLHIFLPLENWKLHYLKIERDKKLRELGL
jgi:hypothetical protein